MSGFILICFFLLLVPTPSPTFGSQIAIFVLSLQHHLVRQWWYKQLPTSLVRRPHPRWFLHPSLMMQLRWQVYWWPDQAPSVPPLVPLSPTPWTPTPLWLREGKRRFHSKRNTIFIVIYCMSFLCELFLFIQFSHIMSDEIKQVILPITKASYMDRSCKWPSF